MVTGDIDEFGYVDLQVNGYVGIDFNNPSTTLQQLRQAAEAMSRDGVVAALPTVITGPRDAMICCIRNLSDAMLGCETVGAIFKGIHVEGPFLSRLPGFIGAHPLEHAAEHDLRLLEELLEAGSGRVRLLTLAPEVDAGASLTQFCFERGVQVAAGHTDATTEQLACCIDSGLSLFTHLGNGCPKLMDRHDNIIFRALMFADQLCYSVIADGFHIPKPLFLHFLRVIPEKNMIVVSDAISAAGLGPGTYQLGVRQVTIGPDGAARDPSGQHFVGSASRMRDADLWMRDKLSLGAEFRHRLLAANPAHYMNETSWL